MIRVLVVDDQALVRAGVAMMLESSGDCEVVGEAADGAAAVRLAARLRPDVVLMDIRMPGVDGVEATRRIVAATPGVRVLMLTTFADDTSVYGALDAGAVGFLLKDAEPDAMLAAVRRSAAGEPALAPSVLSRVLASAVRAHRADADRDPDPAPALNALSGREREVLTLVGAGLSNTEIAERLHLGVTTVKTHISAVMDKLGLRNRVQAAVVAHRLGLVDDEFRPAGR